MLSFPDAVRTFSGRCCDSPSKSKLSTSLSDVQNEHVSYIGGGW